MREWLVRCRENFLKVQEAQTEIGEEKIALGLNQST